MADLYAIYQELGLSSIVPHALRDGSRGYKMLIDKIKAGNPMYFIRTNLDAPFLIVKDGTYQSMFYTARELAEQQAESLDDAGYCGIAVEELPDGQGRREALHWLFDHGPTAILIDDSLSVPISVLTTGLPTYDGRPNDEHMLRNRALNGATFYFLQQAAAGYGNMEAEQQWAKAMYHGELLVPVVNNANKGYPMFTTTVKGQTAFLVYSDWRQLGFDFPDPPAGLISNFEDLWQTLKENTGTVLLLNKSTCHLVIDLSLLDNIKDIAINGNPSSPSILASSVAGKKKNTPWLQTTEEDWDKVDPTPDFLK